MYEDEERTVVTELREYFKRRKDTLRERRIYPLSETTIVGRKPQRLHLITARCTEDILQSHKYECSRVHRT